ncbi:hypothetical protein ACKWTF_005090 [Chironomus riparius]
MENIIEKIKPNSTIQKINNKFSTTTEIKKNIEKTTMKQITQNIKSQLHEVSENCNNNKIFQSNSMHVKKSSITILILKNLVKVMITLKYINWTLEIIRRKKSCENYL